MAEDNNFKFNFDALVNLRLGNVSEFKKQVDDQLKGLGQTVKLEVPNIGPALNSAVQTKIQEKLSTLASSFKALNDEIAKGRTTNVTKLTSSIEKLVSSLVTASQSIDKESAKSASAGIDKLSASIKKLAEATQTQPPVPPKAAPEQAIPARGRAARAVEDQSQALASLKGSFAGLEDSFKKASSSVETFTAKVGDESVAVSIRNLVKTVTDAQAAIAAAIPKPPTPPNTPPVEEPQKVRGRRTKASAQEATGTGGAGGTPPPITPPPGSGGGTGGGSGGGGKPPPDFSKVLDSLRQSFKTLTDNVTTAANAFSKIGGVDELIKAAVDQALRDAQKTPPSGGGTSGPPGGFINKSPAPYDISQAPSILKASMAIRRGYEVTPGAQIDVINTFKSLVGKAVGTSSGLGSTVGKLKTSLPSNLGADIDELAKLYKEAESATSDRAGKIRARAVELVKDLEGKLEHTGDKRTVTEFKKVIPKIYSELRLAINTGLIAEIDRYQDEIEAASKAGLDVSGIRKNQRAVLERGLRIVEAGVGNVHKKRKSVAHSEFADTSSGFIPEVAALVNLGSSAPRTKLEGQKIDGAILLLHEHIKGNVTEVERLRKEWGLVHVDPVRAAIQLITEGLSKVADKAGSLTRIIADVDAPLLTGDAYDRQRLLVSSLKSERNRLVQGKGLKLAPLSEQLAGAASSVGGRGIAASALKDIFSRVDVGAPSGEALIGREVPIRFNDADKAAKRILHTLKENTSSAAEFREELRRVLELLKEINPTTQEEKVTKARLVSRLEATSKQNAQFGGDKAISKPVGLFSIERSDLAPLQKSAGLIASAFDTSTSSLERFHKIIGLLSGGSKEFVKQLLQIREGLLAISKSKLDDVDQSNVIKQISLVDKAIKEVQSGKVPTSFTRSQGLTQAGSFIREEAERLRASGKSSSDKPLVFSIRNEEGQFIKIAASIKNATDAQGRYIVSAKEVKGAMTGVHSAGEQMVLAFRRVAIWGTAAGILYGATRALRDMVAVTFEVDSAVTKVGKVMNEATANFDKFRGNVSAAALEISTKFGVAIQDVLKTMFTFAQQGLEFPQVKELSRTVAVAENVTNLPASDATEALTAAFKQFKIESSDSMRILDAWNEIANRTAIEEDVLAAATKKAGTAAVNAGVNFDQFNGMVASVGSATRQTGEEIGTAFRSIFQRINRPTARNVLGGIGINVSDISGNLKGFVPVITELHEKWEGLTNAQKLNVATGVSGIHHYNTFLTLMENFDDFMADAAISANSQGSAMKENEMVMQTASKQYAILKERVKEAGLEFGTALMPVLKAVIGVASSVVTVFNALPDSFKAVVGGMSLLSLATLKFGHTIDNLLNSLAYLPKANQGFFSSLKEGAMGLVGGIGSGKSVAALNDAQRTAIQGTPGRALTYGVSDFASGAGSEFKRLASVGAEGPSNALALTMAGTGVAASTSVQGMSKFHQAVRGMQVDGKTLEIKDMNSVIAKLGLTMARVGQSIGGYVIALASMLPGLTKVEAATGAASIASKGWLVSMLPLAAAATVLTGVIYGISWAYGKVTDRGDELAKSFDSQVASLEENLKAARETAESYDSLARSRETLAKSLSNPELDTDPLKVIKAAKAVTTVKGQEEGVLFNSKLGGNALEAVDSIDSLGKSTLKSNEALKAMSMSLVEGAATSLAYAKSQQATALAQELVGRKWYQTAAAIDRYKEAVKNAQVFSQTLREGTGGISGLNLTTPAFQEGRKIFGEYQKDIIKTRAKLAEFEVQFKKVLGSLPKETVTDFFQGMAFDDDQVKILEAYAAVFNKDLPAGASKAATKMDALRAIFVSVKTGIKDISPIAEETFKKLVIKGGVKPFGIDEKNLEEVNRQVKRGATDLKDSLAFVNEPGAGLRMMRTVVSEELGLMVETFDDQGQRVFKSVKSLVEAGSKIQIIRPGDISTAIADDLMKAKRLVTGAGAGTIFPGEVKLGARLSQDLTPQERAAKSAPEIFREAYKASEAYEQELKKLTDAHKGEARDKQTEVNFLKTLNELAATLNSKTFVLRLVTELETLEIEAEKAATRIRDLAIDRSVEAFVSQFKLGAEKGVVEGRKFTPQRANFEISQQDRFGRDFAGVIDQFSAREDEINNLKDQEKRVRKLQADIPSFVKEFQKSTGAFKSSGDVTSFVEKLKKEALGSKDTQAAATAVRAAEQVSILKQQLEQQKLTNSLLAKREGVKLKDEKGERALTEKEISANLQGGLSMAINAEGSKDSFDALSYSNIAFIDKFAKGKQEDISKALVQLVGKTPPSTIEDFIKSSEKQLYKQGISPLGPKEEAGSVVLKSSQELVSKLASQGRRSSESDIRELLSSVVDKLKSEKGKIKPGQEEFRVKLFGSAADEKDRAAVAGRAHAISRLQDVIDKISNPSAKLIASFQEEINKAAFPNRTKGAASVEEARKVQGEELVRIAENVLGTTLEGSKKGLLVQKVMDQEFLRSLITAGNSVHKFSSALEDSIISIKRSLFVRDQMQELNAPIAGAMRGVLPPQFSQEDLGRDFQDLSGFERATRAAPNTSKFLSDFKTTETQTKKVAEDMASALFDTELRIKEIRDRGGKDEIGQLNLLEQARGQEASMLDRLKGALSSARDRMGEFFDKFRNIVLVEEAKKKIEDLFRSFSLAKETRFDTHSLDVALGRSPFSITPTKLGEPRNLNAFQRELFGIEKKLSSGVSGEEHSQLSRRKEEIKFDMEEAKITEKQGKEREKLQQQTDLAKNVLDTLGGLKQRGIKDFAGFDVSTLMSTIKSQLEKAGDVTSVGGKQYFKGVPVLGQIEGQLDKLKNVKEEADLKTQHDALMNDLEGLTKESNKTLIEIRDKIEAAFKSVAEKEAKDKPATEGLASSFSDNLKLFTTSSELFKDAAGIMSSVATTFEKTVGSIAEMISSSASIVSDISKYIVGSNKETPTNKAQGGFVSGPSGVDKVPARLTAGEFVISKGGVDALRSSYGDKVLHAINAGRIPRFAEGGKLTRDDFLELIAGEGDSKASQLERPSSISLGLTDANGEYLGGGRFAGIAGAKTLFEQDAAGNVLSGGDRPYYPGAKTIASDLYDKTGTYLISKEQAPSKSKYDDMYRLPTGLQDTSGGKPNFAKIIARANAGEYGQGMQLDVSSGKLRMSNREGSLDETFANMAEGKSSFGNRPAGEHPWGDIRRRVDVGGRASYGNNGGEEYKRTSQQTPTGPYSTWEPLPEGTTEPGPTFRRTPLSYRSAAFLDGAPSSQSRATVAPTGGFPRDAGLAGGIPATESLGRPYVSKPLSTGTSLVFPPDHISRSKYDFPADAISHGKGFRSSRINFKDSEGSTFDNIRFKTGSTIDHLRFGDNEGSTVDYLKFGDNEGSTVLGPRRVPRGPTSSWSPLDKATQRRFEDENYRKKVLGIQNLNNSRIQEPFSTQEPLDRGDLKFYDKGSPVIVVNGHPEDDLIAYVSGEGPTSDNAQLRAWRKNRWPSDFYSEKELEEMKRGKGKSSFRPWSPLRRGFAGGGLVEEDNKYLSQEEGKKLIDDILTQSTNMHVDAYSASQKPSGLSEDKPTQKYLYEQAVKHHNFIGGVKFSGEGDSQTIQLGGKFFPASRESADFLRAQLAETQGILDRLAGEKEARNKSPILSSLTSGEFAKEKGLGVVSDTLLRSVAKPIAGMSEFFGGAASSAGESLDVALKGGLADPLLSRKGFGARLTVAGGLGAAAFGAAALPGAALATIGKGASLGFSALGAYTGGTHIGTGLEKIVSSGKVDADSLSDILGGAGGVALSAGPFLNMAKGMGGKYTPPPPYKPPASYIKRMRDLGEEAPSLPKEIEIVKALEAEDKVLKASRIGENDALWHDLKKSHPDVFSKPPSVSAAGSIDVPGPRLPTWIDELRARLKNDPEFERSALERETLNKVKEAKDVKPYSKGWLNKLRADLRIDEPGVLSKQATAARRARFKNPEEHHSWSNVQKEDAMWLMMEEMEKASNAISVMGSSTVRGSSSSMGGGSKGGSSGVLQTKVGDVIGEAANAGVPGTFRLSAEQLANTRRGPLENLVLSKAEEESMLKEFLSGGAESPVRGVSFSSKQLESLSISQIKDRIARSVDESQRVDLSRIPGKRNKRSSSGVVLGEQIGSTSRSLEPLEFLLRNGISRNHGMPDMSDLMPRSFMDMVLKHGKIKRASGGHISGPGGPTSDIIPILASNGEYVINAKAAQSLGLSRLEYLNNHGKLPKFAEGGLVGSKGATNQQVEIDPSIIAKAIEEAFSSAGQKFSDTVSKIEIPFKVPENLDLTIKPPESTDFLTLKAPDSLDLTIKPPESTDFLTLKVPEIPTLKLPEMPTLKLPDNIPELKISGGPGAARLDAIESSLDIIRENLSGVQKTVETSQETFMSNSGVMDIVSNMLQEYHGNSMTELNERFSATEQNLISNLSGVAGKLAADFSSELLNVESKVTQVSSVAQSALSRSMLRG